MKLVKKIWQEVKTSSEPWGKRYFTTDTIQVKWTPGPGQCSFFVVWHPWTPVSVVFAPSGGLMSIFSSNVQRSHGSSPKSPPTLTSEFCLYLFLHLEREEDLAGNLVTTLNPFELPVCLTYTDRKASVCPTTGRSVKNIHTAAQDFILKHCKRCSGLK